MVTPELPIDVLGRIGERLELLDFLRFCSVCSSWRNSLVVETDNNETPSRHLQPKPQIPWLMLSSLDDVDNNNVYFFSLIESKAYRFQLPETMRGFSHCIGSSEGFLISVHRESGNLLAVNPLTRQQILLPPTADLLPYSLAAQEDRFHKAIVCPSSQAVVICYGEDNSLAFAFPGQDSWTTLKTQMGGNGGIGCTFKYGGVFDDMIFHKGRLHATNFMGELWVYDLLHCSTVDNRPCFRTDVRTLAYEFSNFRRYLVDDPTTDDLYLVFRDSDHGFWYHHEYAIIHRTAIFKVFKLDQHKYDWNEIHSLGDLSLFLGFNRSMALSPRDFPCLQSNKIYFTDDVAVSKINIGDTTDGLIGDMGVFSLDDGSIEPLNISDDLLRRLNWPPPIWFSPTWKREAS